MPLLLSNVWLPDHCHITPERGCIPLLFFAYSVGVQNWRIKYGLGGFSKYMIPSIVLRDLKVEVKTCPSLSHDFSLAHSSARGLILYFILIYFSGRMSKWVGWKYLTSGCCPLLSTYLRSWGEGLVLCHYDICLKIFSSPDFMTVCQVSMHQPRSRL